MSCRDFRSCLLVYASVTPLSPVFGNHTVGWCYKAGAVPHELNKKDRLGALFFLTYLGPL